MKLGQDMYPEVDEGMRSRERQEKECCRVGSAMTGELVMYDKQNRQMRMQECMFCTHHEFNFHPRWGSLFFPKVASRVQAAFSFH